jgi:hypothetical protein
VPLIEILVRDGQFIDLPTSGENYMSTQPTSRYKVFLRALYSRETSFFPLVNELIFYNRVLISFSRRYIILSVSANKLSIRNDAVKLGHFRALLIINVMAAMIDNAVGFCLNY